MAREENFKLGCFHENVEFSLFIQVQAAGNGKMPGVVQMQLPGATQIPNVQLVQGIINGDSGRFPCIAREGPIK